MEKVKVSKEVFEALENFKEGCKPFETAMMIKIKQGRFGMVENLPLNRLSLEELAKCFIVGYELEETPEEKLLRRWNLALNVSASNCFHYREGILNALNDLGIEIKGINT